jgi:hypothetical protein
VPLLSVGLLYNTIPAIIGKEFVYTVIETAGLTQLQADIQLPVNKGEKHICVENALNVVVDVVLVVLVVLVVVLVVVVDVVVVITDIKSTDISNLQHSSWESSVSNSFIISSHKGSPLVISEHN